jgi:hypothetical protein
MTGLGMILVAQRNAVLRSSYCVGEGIRQVHAQQMQLAWQQTRVIGLSAPAGLSDVQQQRGLRFIARSTLRPARESESGFVQLAYGAGSKE